MGKRAVTRAQKKEIIDRLYSLWLLQPGLRLSQLISNVYPCGSTPDKVDMLSALDGNIVLLPHNDPYHVEDFDFVSSLESYYKESESNEN